MTPFGEAPAFRLEVEVQPPQALDLASDGPVRLVAITGGRVLGGLTGQILSGGADWQTVQPDGSIAIEARYLLQLDDGARVEVQGRGIRVPGTGGFLHTLWLRTASPAHAALNSTQFLALGRKRERFVEIAAFALPVLEA